MLIIIIKLTQIPPTSSPHNHRHTHTFDTIMHSVNVRPAQSIKCKHQAVCYKMVFVPTNNPMLCIQEHWRWNQPMKSDLGKGDHGLYIISSLRTVDVMAQIGTRLRMIWGIYPTSVPRMKSWLHFTGHTELPSQCRGIFSWFIKRGLTLDKAQITEVTKLTFDHAEIETCRKRVYRTHIHTVT